MILPNSEGLPLLINITSTIQYFQDLHYGLEKVAPRPRLPSFNRQLFDQNSNGFSGRNITIICGKDDTNIETFNKMNNIKIIQI